MRKRCQIFFDVCRQECLTHFLAISFSRLLVFSQGVRLHTETATFSTLRFHQNGHLTQNKSGVSLLHLQSESLSITRNMKDPEEPRRFLWQRMRFKVMVELEVTMITRMETIFLKVIFLRWNRALFNVTFSYVHPSVLVNQHSIFKETHKLWCHSPIRYIYNPRLFNRLEKYLIGLVLNEAYVALGSV